MEGIVKWYDSVGCVGFIIGEDSQELFFRKKDVALERGVFPGLCCGDKVLFKVGSKEKRTDYSTAIQIKKLEAYRHAR